MIKIFQRGAAMRDQPKFVKSGKFVHVLAASSSELSSGEAVFLFGFFLALSSPCGVQF